MKQLHIRNTFITVHRRDMKYKGRQKVLEPHVFIKQKLDGKIKGQTVSGGNKQCTFIPKEDSSSPTVNTKSALLTSIADSEENRYVAIIDILNAFIKTRVGEKITWQSLR